MNENLNLVEILKDCPKGTKLYSTMYGEVEFKEIDIDYGHPIRVWCKGGPDCFTKILVDFTKDGKIFCDSDGECLLFPSKDQRDWSKFNYKKPKFDPKILQSFDKVLVRDGGDYNWRCELFSHIKTEGKFKYWCISNGYKCCIPYNDDTKHLVGTTNEAPEFYRYWED